MTIFDAIISLRPGAEWSMSGEDISTLEFHTEGVEPLTEEQVKKEITRLKTAATNAKKAAAEARAAAIEHAKSLGFTDAMIAVMYPNLSVAGDVTE